MDTALKVLVLPNICGVHIDASGTPTPTVNPSLQPFYNSLQLDGDPRPVYSSPGKVAMSERGRQTKSGMQYTQEVQLRFPSNDPLRAVRIEQFLKVKFISITLSTGMVLHFGRNDYYQNTRPQVGISSNEKTTTVTFQTKSIFTLGFTNPSETFDFPGEIPLNFYNL